MMTELFHVNRLVETLEHQADWRLQKAYEYSHHDGNERSAQALIKLAENLRKLAADEPLVAYYDELWEGAVTYLEEFGELSSIQDNMIRLYGFHKPEDGDALVFLQRLTDWLQSAYEQSGL